MNEHPYMKLVKFILPSEMTEYFDLVDVALDQYGDEQRLHLYLDEKDIKPENQPDATSNGFYEESCINDFPIREYRTILHVRRRRWKGVDGKKRIKGLAVGCQGHSLLERVCDFFKRIPWIHPRLQPGRSRNHIT